MYLLAKKTESLKNVELRGEKMQKRVRTWLIAFYFSFCTLSNLIMTQNEINSGSPMSKDPAFTTDTGIPILVKLFSNTIAITLTCLFESLVHGFALFAKRSLAVLSNDQGARNNNNGKGTGYREDITSSMFEVNLNLYNDLRNLLNQFNECFSYLLLIFKAFALLNVYFFVFCVTRYKTHLRGHFLYYFLPFLHVSRVLCILPPLAAVYIDSVHFKESWSKSLKYLTPLQKNQIALIQPFGIKPGTLYVVIPSTILTFISVMTTHVIVLLQIL